MFMAQACAIFWVARVYKFTGPTAARDSPAQWPRCRFGLLLL